jgi:L-asparaginase
MNAAQKLLLLYTGGTIGMQMSANGLVPASGFAERLRAEQAAHPQRPAPQWQFAELLPPIDSANMTQAHWLAMRDAIVAGVEQQGCDAVLLLHGTDTLAYSAAALSFLLLGLNVPVILTGSMLPAGVANGDAWPNLFGALALLAEGVAPGVHLYFNGQLLHGARVSKLRSEAFDAFVDSQRPRHGQQAPWPATLSYHCKRQPVSLAIQPLFPGISAAQLRASLSGEVRGLLLECYGSGTGPADDPQLLTALREAHQRGVVLAAISQCPQGHVEFAVYAAGSALASCGLVSGGGMTREAALGKLFALLGAGLTAAEAEHWLAIDLCGEMAD